MKSPLTLSIGCCRNELVERTANPFQVQHSEPFRFEVSWYRNTSSGYDQFVNGMWTIDAKMLAGAYVPYPLEWSRVSSALYASFKQNSLKVETDLIKDLRASWSGLRKAVEPTLVPNAHIENLRTDVSEVLVDVRLFPKEMTGMMTFNVIVNQPVNYVDIKMTISKDGIDWCHEDEEGNRSTISVLPK